MNVDNSSERLAPAPAGDNSDHKQDADGGLPAAACCASDFCLTPVEGPYGSLRTEEDPLLPGESEYNESHSIPLRELALAMLEHMLTIEAALDQGDTVGSPSKPTHHLVACAAFESWKAAGRPIGRRWVEVFFEFLQRDLQEVQ